MIDYDVNVVKILFYFILLMLMFRGLLDASIDMYMCSGDSGAFRAGWTICVRMANLELISRQGKGVGAWLLVKSPSDKARHCPRRYSTVLVCTDM